MFGGIGLFEFSVLIFLVVVLLASRELVCWYWKQNEQVKLLREIRDLMKTDRLPEYAQAKEADSPETLFVFCGSCGQKNLPGTPYCRTCNAPLP